MVYGTETWLLKVEDITRISRADKRMIRRMPKVSLKDGRSSDKFRNRLEIPDISDVIRKIIK